MGFEQLLQRIADARTRALAAAQAAQDDRRRRRQENDLWVTGGVNWNGYGLEPLIKMVAERASPAQLNALAGEWGRHGGAVSTASTDLQKSLTTLLQYWSGTAADEAARKVMTNARWIGELGQTAQQMSGPIMDAGGALRSAQDTMPGVPKNNWLGTAGGGAMAGFAVAGPIGAAFGAAIGGIASVFGFGNKKKKMKRKAVQTMERYEGALLGIDQVTPQFPGPSNGSNPGDGWVPAPGDGIGRPGIPVPPPGGGVVKPSPPPIDGHTTDPSFAHGPDPRWQSLTGLGPNVSGVSGLGGGGGGAGGSGFGLGTGPFGGVPGMGGRGAGGMGGPVGRGGGAGARGAGGRGAGGRGGGGFPGGMGGGGRGGDRDYRGRGRFNKAGAFGTGGGAPGGRRDEEEDSEHRRSVPIEEDLFSSDQKAAPPVIGL